MTAPVQEASLPSPTLPPANRGRPTALRLVPGIVVVAILAILPFLDLVVPVLLPGPFSSASTMLVIAVGLVYAGLAVSYDVLFGYTGLLSAGHAMLFALGTYNTNILMTHGWGYVPALVAAVLLTTLIAAGVGALAVKATGIAFTMVTLAFGEALFVLLLTDPWGIFGGDEGLPLASLQVPQLLASARDTKWIYWLALAFAIFAYVASMVATRSRCGQVWLAIRENEERVEMLGLVPYVYKLMAFIFSGFIAGLAGGVYILVARGASPSVSSVDFSLALIVMVVVGGRGRLWGAAIGGMLYALLTYRIPEISRSSFVGGLPETVGQVLAEPLFITGAVFVVLVLFAPNGLVGIVERVADGWRRRRGQISTRTQP